MVLLIIVLVLFPLVLLTLLLPEHKRGNAVYYISRRAVDVGMFCWVMYHRNIYEAPHTEDRPSVFVFNHISYLDALIILKAVRRQRIRGLGKFEISKIPVFGYIYKSAVVMVKRDDATDRARSVSDLKAAISQNISIILAPEGTFNTTPNPLIKFYDGAFRIAIETQTPIRPLLFLDTFDRMNYNSMLSLTPGKSRVVYLEEVAVEGYTLDELPLLKQKVFEIMEAGLLKYKATWIGK